MDYIFTTPDVLQCAREAGHYDFKQLIQTADHCGLYLKIDANILFNMKCMDITHPCMRQLQLSKRQVVEKYIKVLKDFSQPTKKHCG